MFDLKHFKNCLKDKSNFFFAGTDEVGRGPLAGPVVAACASLRFKEYQEKELRLLLKEWAIFGITDSKKLTAQKRQAILSDLPFEQNQMKADQIYSYSYSKNMTLKVLIKEISPQTIDEINILNASLKAMKEAVAGCCDFDGDGVVMIDGNSSFKIESSPVQIFPIIKGDTKSLLIGMASIIAKEYRDQLMARYCDQFPGYNWKNNAGYATAKHLEAISLLGTTEIHRKSFRGVKEIYEQGR